MVRLILTCVQVFASFAIVGLVLLQRGKGADAGAGFGSGASGTVFGARGATTALSRATAVFAAIFMINSLALAYLSTSAGKQEEVQKSILDEAATQPKNKPAAGGSAPAPLPATAPPAPTATPGQSAAPPPPTPTPTPASTPTPAPASTPTPAPASTPAPTSAPK
jgi:preprotein translocase subunit SecG